MGMEAMAASVSPTSCLPIVKCRQLEHIDHGTRSFIPFRSFHVSPLQLRMENATMPRHLCIMDCSRAVTDKEVDLLPNTDPSPDVLKIWQNADAVCFDVDSTVCIDEGIDELASFCGAGEAVAAWTSRAMGGSVPFEEALAARLALFRPSLSNVTDFLANRPPRLSPGITTLIKMLQAKGKSVYLVSGGFRQMIEPAAELLEIPKENIYANRLLFNEDGTFLGFDNKEPTCRSGGKAVAISQIKKERNHKLLAMLGDGATDLEARRPGGADIFICYGGIQLRAAVAAKADWLILNFQDLIGAL